MLRNKPLFIQTRIRTDMDTLWAYTQQPGQHQEWDLRFSTISYLPKDGPEEPQRFLYSTRIGFGLTVNGTGESVATRQHENGDSTSVLKFWSGSPISLIRSGSGYWKYTQDGNEIIFTTGYDYQPRWGVVGQWIDGLIFRPLMVWATAWSFDSLKNWIESGIHPRTAIRAQWTIFICSLVLSISWFYHGLVPKILFPNTGEVILLEKSGLFTGFEDKAVTAIGIAEMIWAVLILFYHRKFLHYLNMLALFGLMMAAFLTSPLEFTKPFTPFTLNISMMCLSAVILLQLGLAPKASNSKTKKPKP